MPERPHKVMSAGTWSLMAERIDRGEPCPQCKAEWKPIDFHGLKAHEMEHASDCLWNRLAPRHGKHRLT